jgi:DUF4097 and DUF4098 domain-containing protein YvlB
MSIPIIFILILCVSVAGAAEEKMEKRFERKEAVEIKTISGDCAVRVHRYDDIRVEVSYDSGLEDVVKFSFREGSRTLSIEEDWRGSGSGGIEWTIRVPEDTDVEFRTASGDFTVSGIAGELEGKGASSDFELEKIKGDVEISVASGDISITGCSGDIEISTASGDISMEDCSGEIELSTASGDISASGIEGDDIEISAASGDIEIEDAGGGFDLSVASGEVRAEGIRIKSDSEFSTASGEISVVLADSPEADMELSTASGDVLLDYNGHRVAGYFEFTAKKDGGKIESPFRFDSEEEFEKNGRTYLRKSFSREGDSPEIYLKTASGRVELKK